MLWIILLIVLLCWGGGAFVFALGPLVHLLLVIALVILIVQLLSGRRGPSA